jgi:hypothetical protein
MNDELKPELKDAMEKLPRERMPAGLEAMVTDAMRDHGFLEKRRRVVAVTSGRMAGLLAASVALMVGAYSIGLHRGGDAMLPAALTRESDVRAAKEPSSDATHAPLEKSERISTAKPLEEPAVAQSPTETEGAARSEAGKDPATDASTDRDRRLEERKEGRATSDEVISATPPAPQSAAPEEAAPAFDKSIARPQAEASSPAGKLSGGSRTFLLNGVPLVVDAPDSVRVVEDERGRMLFIYTSDGVIRIRLAGDD